MKFSPCLLSSPLLFFHLLSSRTFTSINLSHPAISNHRVRSLTSSHRARALERECVCVWTRGCVAAPLIFGSDVVVFVRVHEAEKNE